MKNIAGAIVLFFLMVFAYTKLAGPIPFSLQSIVTNKTDAFSVSGEGKVTFVPDIAVVSIGVTSQGSTVSRVQQELNTKMNAVTDAVKKLGIEGKDMKTSYYHITPTYDYSSGTNRITGYQARTSVIIKVRKIDNANAVIDAATVNGANEVSGVSFDVDDKTKAENEARELAVKDAKSKAETAAKAAGFRLGRVVNYSEGNEGFPEPLLYDTVKAMPEEGPLPTQVQPGSSEITVTVTLSYEIL